MKFLNLLLCLLIVSTNVSALDYKNFTLENGLEVYLIEDHRSPTAVNFVWYKIGAGDEVDGKTGLAHMLEHLMFKGTDKIPPQEFSKIIARNGGRDNAFTSYDYTGYFQKIARDKLELAMEMEADRMENLKFSDKDFQPERKVVAEERRWRVESNPKNRFFEEFQGKHFTQHPYGRPVVGYMKDIQTYTRADALKWYNDYYTPNNAILVLAGDITLADAKTLAEKTYGKVKNTPKEIPAWKSEPLITWGRATTAINNKSDEKTEDRGNKIVPHQRKITSREFNKTDKEVKVPVWIRMYRTPSSFVGVGKSQALPQKSQEAKLLRKEALQLSVLAEVLGGGMTSRLYKSLVKEQKLANSISASYSGTSRGETTFDIIAQPKTGIKLAQLKTAIEKEIIKVKRKGVTKDELSRVINKSLASDTYARDDAYFSAYYLGRWLASGGRAEDFDEWKTAIKTITPADIKRLAKKYLRPENSSTGELISEVAH